MKPRLELTLFAVVILILLSLLTGCRTTAQELVRDPADTLSPAGLNRAGVDGAALDLTPPSPALTHTV